MDGVALDGLPAAPADPATRRDLLRLSAAALAFSAVVGAAVQYGRHLVSPPDTFPFIDFPGWQVTTMKAVLGVAVALLGLVAAAWLRRSYRALRGRTPHRRAIALAAVLPGLLVGAAVGLPADPLLSWASEYTASASAARAQWTQMQHDLRYAPAPAPMHYPAAPPEMAGALLRPADLGADWYPSTRPDPTEQRIPVGAAGAMQSARSWLTQAHRNGQGWVLGLGVFETETRFGSSAQASHYARVLASGRHACPCDDRPGPVVRGRIRHADVWSASNSTHLWSVFVADDRVFEVVVLSDQAPTPSRARLTRPLRLAVARALQSA